MNEKETIKAKEKMQQFETSEADVAKALAYFGITKDEVIKALKEFASKNGGAQ